MAHKHTNRLAGESSPYLKQHQHNPVEWFPWCTEAFEKAEAENKLVLISVGYSACHWCHVMERETFEDEEAAAFMNAHFVNIKVDREERPDVDQVYMTAVQLMTQRGGWPLNCFALPDGRPVYGGTYFPKAKWKEVLQLLVDLQRDEPEKVYAYAEELTHAVGLYEKVEESTNSTALPKSFTSEWVDAWEPHWDRERGGLDHAPKFPMPNNWDFLLEHGILHQDSAAADHAHKTVQSILRGGIADQLGGGIARYSVDALWKVPHFEKMLYDNGQWLGTLGAAYGDRPLAEYKRAAMQLFAWLERDLKHPDGWYFSALDADSEGVEGLYYTWNKDELKEIWGTDYAWASEYYAVNLNGYWEDERYIPLRTTSDAQFAQSKDWTLEELHVRVDDLIKRTLDVRKHRTPPGLDDKVLISWNAWTVTGLCKAAQHMDHPPFAQRAAFIAERIWDLWEQRGHLPHTLQQEHIGFLEDHAAAAQAFLAVYRVSQDEVWVDRAARILEQTWQDFGNGSGMPYYTAHTGEQLVSRKQENFDNVTPSSSSVFARACMDLGTLLGDTEWTQRSQQLLRNMVPEMRSPQHASNWGILMHQATYPYVHVCIAGPDALEAAQAFDRVAHPNTLVSVVTESSELPTLQGKQSDTLTFYLCEEGTCKRPVHTLSEALEQLTW